MEETDVASDVQNTPETQQGKPGSAEKPLDYPGESTTAKPAKTFSRVTKKIPENKAVVVATSMSIETTVLPQESSIDLKTLSLANFESEDPDFALVRYLVTPS